MNSFCDQFAENPLDSIKSEYKKKNESIIIKYRQHIIYLPLTVTKQK